MCEGGALIFLDLNCKLANDIFEEEVFIRVANLDKKNPLLQINDTIFKGCFDHAMGTNLFFEANQMTPKWTDIFIKRGSIQYDNVANEIKTLSMKPVKVPPREKQYCRETEKIEFNLDWDYNTILQKFSEGSLQLGDILKDVIQQEDKNDKIIIEIKEKVHIEDQDKKCEDNATEQDNCVYLVEEEESVELKTAEILEDYERLKRLASKPVKTCSVEEDIQKCDPNFEDAYELHNLCQQILQPCDFFRTEPVGDINEENLCDCIDIDRCVLYGILSKTTTSPRKLTRYEKEKVFSLDNFDNLSFTGRYYVLKNHVKNLEKIMKNKNEDELLREDQYGRSAKRILEIFRKLTDTVKKRIEEIKYSMNDDD